MNAILYLMENISAKAANEQTMRFYESEARSFSETRRKPWNGWFRVLEHLRTLKEPTSLLDIGCGNLRFEHFLMEQGISIDRTTAIDSCATLVDEGASINALEFRQLDVMQALEDNTLSESIAPHGYDVAVAFGFMHHIFDRCQRRALLDTLVESLANGGLAIVSFWQLSKDKRLLDKALQTSKLAEIELGMKVDTSNGDFFLGWQDDAHVFRYCHDFSDQEIAEMTDSFNVIDRFVADGKNDDLNSYVVIKKS